MNLARLFFKSKIFLKAFFIVFIMIISYAGYIYFVTIPIIKKNTYSLEEKLAKSLLDKTLTLVENTHRDLIIYREFALESHKNKLKNLTEIVDYVVKDKYFKFKEGLLSEKEAQKLAIEEIENFRYGESGYFWINDFSPKMIMHPTIPSLNGNDLSGFKDTNGVYLFNEFVKVAIEKKEGFVSYMWPKPNFKEPQPKISFIKSFNKWNWIYGTGVYINDVEQEVQRRKENLIAMLQTTLLSTKIGKTGYMFIFDRDSNMIVHPNIKGKITEKLIEPQSGEKITDLIVDAYKTKEKMLYYKWNSPDDLDNYIYDKISWIEYFEPLGWYICSSAYIDELNESSVEVKNIILVVSIIVLILSFGLGYYFFRKLLSPIDDLATLALKVKKGDFSVKSNIVRDDEIGILAKEFDNMVSTIQNNINTLDTKVEKKTKELKVKNDTLTSLSNKLSKYLSPQIYDMIFSGKQDVTLDSKRKKLTIFFSDIVSFTKTTDNLQPEDLTNILNYYLTQMSKIALKYGATIDKFVGDAILIFFGDPDSKGVKQDAMLCALMAIEMRKRVLDMRDELKEYGIAKPFEIRMGINTGYCTVGNFGSSERMDYTIIGGEVNLASRLETSSDKNEILISEETYLLIKDNIECRAKGKIEVKGINKPIKVYQIVDVYKSIKLNSDIDENEDGFSIHLDLELIKKLHKKEEIAKELEDILNRVKKI